MNFLVDYCFSLCFFLRIFRTAGTNDIVIFRMTATNDTVIFRTVATNDIVTFLTIATMVTLRIYESILYWHSCYTSVFI